MATSAYKPVELRGGSRATRLGAVDWASLLLLIAGGINWACVGLFGVDLVAALFGQMTTLARIIYVAVGMAAVQAVFMVLRLGNRPVRSGF